MRIAIVGYGRMGRLIKRMVEDEGTDTVSAVIDPAAEGATHVLLSRESLASSDVVIDFSSAAAEADNIRLYADLAIPAVIGTTGWYDRMPSIQEDIGNGKARIIWSANFSIGVHIFLSLVEEAGRLINRFPSYDAAISEVHHRAKADAPSGTALMAAERILRTMDRKERIETDASCGPISGEAISIASERVGAVPGTHTLMLDSPFDTIEITHRARTREGFAEGAVMAARWIAAASPGFYTMDDLIASIRGGNEHA